MSPREGDHQDHRRLMRLLGDRRRFYGYALVLTGDPDDAEDLLQDSVLKALRAIGDLRNDTAFESWFFRLIKNTFIDTRRRKNAVQMIPVRIGGGEEISVGQEDTRAIADPERIAVSRLAAEDVWRSLDMLPPQSAEVAVLHYVMEYTVPEIVERTGEADGTIRSRISRVRTKLRALLSRIHIL